MSSLVQVVQQDILPYSDYLLTLPDTATRGGTPITDVNGLCKALVSKESASGDVVVTGNMTYNSGTTPPQWEYVVPAPNVIPGRRLFAQLQVCNLAGSVVYYTAPMRLRPVY